MPSSENDALSQALAMVVGPLLMGLLGAWLDHVVGTGWVFTAVLASWGVIGGFAAAYYRHAAQMAKHDEGKPWVRRSMP
jgi:positive regulator of sigma E activity